MRGLGTLRVQGNRTAEISGLGRGLGGWEGAEEEGSGRRETSL